LEFAKYVTKSKIAQAQWAYLKYHLNSYPLIAGQKMIEPKAILHGL